MKRRSSIEQAEWSIERENQYKKDCFNLAFDYGDKLKTNVDAVYLIKDGKEIELARPLKQNTFWYETWLELKSFYQIE